MKFCEYSPFSSAKIRFGRKRLASSKPSS